MTCRIVVGNAIDVLRGMPEGSANCCVTSPPYWGLRDYGVADQLGLEKTPDEYVSKMVEVFRDVRRVLRDDGTLWLNIGDSYAAGGKSGGGWNGEYLEKAGAKTTGPRGGHWQPPPKGLKQKDLVGIPWMLAFALRADGWYLRSEIIWHKPNPMPESVTDRPTKAHEQIFLLAKSARYYYDAEAIKEDAVEDRIGKNRGGSLCKGSVSEPTGLICGQNHSGDAWVSDGQRNKRSVWTVASHPYSEAHFATYPPDLIEPCVLAGCPKGGEVLDPFFGAGTTGLVAIRTGRNCTGIELNPKYAEIAQRRIHGPLFSDQIEVVK